jgi:hypothetical protein
MKKIAFCLSGHLRTFRETLSSFNEFKEFIKKNIGDIDVFISTWEYENHPADSSTPDNNEGNFIDLELINNYYSPLSISVHSYAEIEKYLTNNYFKPDFNFDSFGPTHSKNNLPHHMRQHFLLYQASKLKDSIEKLNNFTYDIVFRIRPDYLFHKGTYLNIDFENIASSTFYSYKWSHDDFCDIFGFSDSPTFSKYANIFFNLKQIGNDTGVFCHPERLIYYNGIINNFNFCGIPMTGRPFRKS